MELGSTRVSDRDVIMTRRITPDTVMARLLQLQTQAALLVEDIEALGGTPDDVSLYAARVGSLLTKLERRLTSHFRVSAALRVGKQECDTCHETYPYTLDNFYAKKRTDGKYRLLTTCKACWNKQTVQRTERARRRRIAAKLAKVKP